MDTGVWWATVHGVAKSRTRLSDFTFKLWSRASLVAQRLKRLPGMWETWVRSLGWEDPLEKGKTTPTPIFWPGEFHGLYSPGGCKESDTTE